MLSIPRDRQETLKKLVSAYALAAASATMALLFTLYMAPLRNQFKFLVFFLAVCVSANWGAGSAIFATLLAITLADFFLLPPPHSLAGFCRGVLLPDVLFCAAGLVIAWTTHRLQRSEETVRAAAAVVESSADSIMQQGLDNTILTWNQAAEHLYGYTAKEIIGRSVALLVPPDRREKLQHLVEGAHNGNSAPGYDTVRVRKDGTLIDVSVTVSPI